MRLLQAAAVVALAGAAPMLGGYALEAARAGGAPATALGPGVVTVEVDMRYSRFSVDELHVRPGTLVRFVVTNSDPIHHELVVGDEAVHRAHREGAHPLHPPVPGEVSVAPGRVGFTAYRFDEPGTVRFVCHLPGHEHYGMHGSVVVAPS